MARKSAKSAEKSESSPATNDPRFTVVPGIPNLDGGADCRVCPTATPPLPSRNTAHRHLTGEGIPVASVFIQASTAHGGKDVLSCALDAWAFGPMDDILSDTEALEAMLSHIGKFHLRTRTNGTAQTDSAEPAPDAEGEETGAAAPRTASPPRAPRAKSEGRVHWHTEAGGKVRCRFYVLSARLVAFKEVNGSFTDVVNDAVKAAMKSAPSLTPFPKGEPKEQRHIQMPTDLAKWVGEFDKNGGDFEALVLAAMDATIKKGGK